MLDVHFAKQMKFQRRGIVFDHLDTFIRIQIGFLASCKNTKRNYILRLNTVPQLLENWKNQQCSIFIQLISTCATRSKVHLGIQMSLPLPNAVEKIQETI